MKRVFHSILAASILTLNLAAISPGLPANTGIVPNGTTINLLLKQELSTSANKVGDTFTAEVVQDVVVNGQTVIPHGAMVDGQISKLEKPKRLAGMTGKASLVLRFDRIRTRSGEEPIVASLVSVHDPVESKPQEKVGEEGKVEAKTDTKGILTKGAIGVAAGTVLGAVFGNVSRGLALGSIGGAVAILAPKGKDVTLPKESGLQIRLDRDLDVPPGSAG